MKKLIVVISGLPGAGSSTVAKAVAKKLKLKLFSAGDLHKKMFEGWKNKEAMAALEVWKTEKGASEKTHKDRDKLIAEIAKERDIVICAKLGIHFLKKLSKYKIWLDAPIKIRAERSSKRDNVPIDEVLKQLSIREDMERANWKRIYGFDYFDQKKGADLAIDTSNLTVDQTVEKILKFIKSNKS